MIEYELLIGDLDDASDLEALAIYDVDTILNVSNDNGSREYPEEIDVHQVGLLDGPQNDTNEFRTAVETLIGLLHQGRTVLIHCVAGASRSVSVAAAAIAIIEDITVDESLALIESERPQADPHPALIERATHVAQVLRD